MTAPDKFSTEKPDELADLIDRLMAQGNGHINITADENNEGLMVSTVKSTDFAGKKGACCQPNEADDDDDEF